MYTPSPSQSNKLGDISPIPPPPPIYTNNHNVMHYNSYIICQIDGIETKQKSKGEILWICYGRIARVKHTTEKPVTSFEIWPASNSTHTGDEFLMLLSCLSPSLKPVSTLKHKWIGMSFARNMSGMNRKQFLVFLFDFSAQPSTTIHWYFPCCRLSIPSPFSIFG